MGNPSKLILVDEKDNQIGEEEKLKAHKEGLLHRAFSIFIFNDKQELMLQRRASNKYHSGGLWSNACCSHPSPGEELIESAHKRLIYEMGFDCDLEESIILVYKAKLGKLIENEYDHIILGRSNNNPHPNSEEADDWKWISLDELQADIEKRPQSYTFWFKIAIPKLREHLKNRTQIIVANEKS